MRVVQMNASSNQKRSFPQKASNPPPIVSPKRKLDFSAFKKDDWILLGIIVTLILEGSDDYILLCALGYLFIMGL